MSLQFFNTLSGKKELFTPLIPNKVTMYCCGITPYGNTHIGHSRTFFSYDLLYRALIDHNYQVNWARNITDIDDKIIKKAVQEQIPCAEIVARYVTEQDDMLHSFHLERPQKEPRVTESIPQIIALITKLIEKSYAYVTNSGVYFRVRKFPAYGKLSKNKIDDLKKGARIEIDESKEDALDFALWKFVHEEELRSHAHLGSTWASPWGNGRPGWHIECSAMVSSLYGDSIDIHMGGRDLIFPHHEAEIAQSEAASGKTFAKLWLHTGMVTLYGEKMSKSTNHYVGIKDFLEKYPAEALRLVFLSVSYAQPLDFTFEMVTENLKKLAKLYRFVALMDFYSLSSPISATSTAGVRKESSKVIFKDLSTLSQKMRSCLADDLNSSASLAVFFDFIKSVNTQLQELEKASAILGAADRDLLKTKWPEFKNWVKNALGLLLEEPKVFFENLKNYGLSSEISAEQIQQKIDLRDRAREAKDWAESDSIRAELLSQGIQLQDTPHGTRWTIYF